MFRLSIFLRDIFNERKLYFNGLLDCHENVGTLTFKF